MKKKLVAGNWKMNGSRASTASLLAELGSASYGCDVVVCPPFPYLSQASEILAGSPVGWGAQDMSEHPPGAFTGEICSEMLVDFHCRYVIVGHSERRARHGETDAVVGRKAARAVASGITPVVCVGETQREREQGITDAVVARQLRAVGSQLGPGNLPRIVVAYEPVWAIGTGLSATAEQIQEVHGWIRELLNWAAPTASPGIRVLYGGSVKPANAAQLLSLPNVDGALVGGASLTAHEFLAICQAASD